MTGSDKASIDTGVDTADAGSNDWTNGDLLEIWIYARTDNALATASPVVTLNNLGTSIYDRMVLSGINATASAANSLAQAAWTLTMHGGAALANQFSIVEMTFPNFAGTTGLKQGRMSELITDSTAANNNSRHSALGFRATGAITRFKIAAAGAEKFKVGTQLLIYKRLAS